MANLFSKKKKHLNNISDVFVKKFINYILIDKKPWPVFKRLCYVPEMCNCTARSHSMFFTLNRGIS